MATVDAIAQNLLELDEEDLIAQLGTLQQNVAIDPSAGDLEALEEPIAVPRGAWDEVLKMGQSVFGPASSGAYKVLCSPLGGDTDLAKELDNLMNQKTAEASAKAAAMLTPILAGSMGLPQSLAVVAGAVLVKKLAKGTSDFVCDNWKKNIEVDDVPETASSASD